jgi:hypothetical protein
MGEPGEYDDLTPGATVHHPKYGAGVVAAPVAWKHGQVLIRYPRGTYVYCNPARLSTDTPARVAPGVTPNVRINSSEQ